MTRKQFFKKLQSYIDLDITEELYNEGWRKPTPHVKEIIKNFLSCLHPTIKIPELMLDFDGEVDLWWRNDFGYAEFGISRNGANYFFINGINISVHKDNIEIDDPSMHMALMIFQKQK